MSLEDRLAALVEARDALKEVVATASAKVGLKTAKECHDKLEEHRQLNDEFTEASFANQPVKALERIGASRDAIPRRLIDHLYGSYVLLDEVEAGRSDADSLWCLKDSARALKAAME